MTSRRREEVVETDVDPAAREEPCGSEPQGSSPESELLERLDEVETKRDEYLELLQRVQADFENYRKRAAREQERLVAHAHERLVRELLPVLDDLERAAKPPIRDTESDRGNRVQVPPTELSTPDLRSEYEALREGVKLVEQSLRKALEKEGLVEIETAGPFDPHVHDALLTQPSEQAEPGSVLEVVQRGYRLGGKVVRPARVIVAE
ncbi:MAG TPA: nucleotide exchange factor GrpE [Gaiellaceae bacterium]|nr:nucleotide exchange factor GrpE [Gaiellaceae bacterium]